MSRMLDRSIDKRPDDAVPRIWTLGQLVSRGVQSGAVLDQPKSTQDARGFSVSPTSAGSAAGNHSEERQAQATDCGLVLPGGRSGKRSVTVKQLLGSLLRCLR